MNNMPDIKISNELKLITDEELINKFLEEMPYKKYVDILFTKLLAVYSYKDYYIAVMSHTDSYALGYTYEMVVFTADGSSYCVGHPKDDSELEFDLTPHIIDNRFISTIKRNQKSESFIPTMSIKQLKEELEKFIESNLPEFQKMDKLCDLDKHLSESGRYIGMKDSKYGIYRYVRTTQKFDGSWNYDYKLISPEFNKEQEAIEWFANDLLDKNSEEDLYSCIKEGSFVIYDAKLNAQLGTTNIKSGKLNTNPKFPTGDNKGIDPVPNYMLEPNKAKANNLRRDYIKTHGKTYEGLNEKVPTYSEGGPLLVPIEPTEQRKQDRELVKDLFRWSDKIEGTEFKWDAREQYTGVNCFIERKNDSIYGRPCISAYIRLDLPSYHMEDDKNYIQLELGLDRYAPRDKELEKQLKNKFVSTKEDLQNLGFTEIKESRSGGEDWLDGYMYFNTPEECISKWKELAPIIIEEK